MCIAVRCGDQKQHCSQKRNKVSRISLHFGFNARADENRNRVVVKKSDGNVCHLICLRSCFFVFFFFFIAPFARFLFYSFILSIHFYFMGSFFLSRFFTLFSHQFIHSLLARSSDSLRFPVMFWVLFFSLSWCLFNTFRSLD